MDFDNSKPIYLQIIDHVKKEIIKEELKVGEKMPSQREMAQKLKVNPNTVQRAYREMESMNLIETYRGQGTFIIREQGLIKRLKAEMAEEILDNFLREMLSLGISKDEIIDFISKTEGERK
ncbi:GntR family transcriptional regulator [Proteinivorax tanatarense]|uniref:GntR family transcriptional regulator n=1 Tax=Proteinivorax tanatarense TaxID=1260629 RepID=A0AAU7VMU3_9FIRM